MLFSNTHVNHAIREFLRNDIHATARGHRSGDTNNAVILLREFQKRLSEHVRKRGIRAPWRKRQTAFGVERSNAVPLGRVLHGSIKAASLLGQDMHQARTRLFLDALQQHNELVDVMAIDRAKVTDAQIFKETARLHYRLRRIFRLQEQVTETRSENTRQALHQAVQVRTHLVVDRVRNHAVQVLAEVAHVRGDAHLVVVQDDGHVLLRKTCVVDGLVGHTARHGAVTDYGHHAVLVLEVVACHGKTEGCRNRSRRVSGAVAVVLAFVPLQKSGNAALLAQRLEAVETARQKLVYIGLVAHVPHDLVVGSIEHVMQGKRQFHDTQARSQVTAMLRHLTDDGLADLRRQVIKLVDRAMLYVLGGLDILKVH